nr:Spz-1 [Portunus trituberculatus]
MLKLLLMVVAAVAVSSWVGGGEVMVAAQPGGGARVVFTDELPMPELISKTRPPCVDSNNIGGDLCEEDPEYDDNIKRRVSMLMERDRGVNALLSDPSLRGLLVDVDPEPRVNVRFGGDSETPVCSAQETLIYPKRAKTPNDEWVFVLNQEGVQQALRVEKCTSDGSACLGMVLPNGGTATCRQKHIYRRLLVLGTNKIEPEEVLMPSCCVCYTTYQDLVTRIGNSTRGRKPPSSTPPRDDPVAPSMPTSSDPVAAPVAGHAHFLPLRFNRSNRRSASVLYPFGGKR